jgi:lipid A 3-O-deacylase
MTAAVLRTLLAMVLVGLAGAAQAQSADQSAPGLIDEVRFGAHAHAVSPYFWPYYVESWELGNVSDVSVDVLFTSPDIDIFRWLGSPRPEVGITGNFLGEESLLHASLTWQLPIFETGLYLEGSLGAAAHTGRLAGAPEGERNFGCRINFYERFGAGANLGDNLTATLTYEHTSNWNLCEENSGLSNVGLRLGWKF